MTFSKKQQYELLASISARGEIPLKFVYLEKGAQYWDKLYKDKTGVTGAEMPLLLSHINSFTNPFSKTSGINLIDLGCGNGVPAAEIIEQLFILGFKVNYVAVDISQEMIDMATSFLKAKFKGLHLDTLLIDFEKETLTDSLLKIKQETSMPNLLLNLGNTLGNYTNPTGTLTNFLEAMGLDDYLIIGNGISNNQNSQKILNSYTNNLQKEIIVLPATQLGIFDDSVDEFNFIWNENLNRVECKIKLKSEKHISLADQELKLESGDEILVMRSQKYSEASLTKLLSDVGFRTEMLTTTKNRNYILSMIQPTRYSVN